MTGPSDTAGSKGMRMIAGYRAERLSQRPLLRTSLRRPHAGMRAEQAPPPAMAAAPAGADEPAAPEGNAGLPASVFGGLFTQAEARQQVEAAAECPAEALPDLGTQQPEPASAAPVGEIPEAPPTPEVAGVAAEASPGPAELPGFDPPLAEIGFGPGMLIRLSQIGLNTTGDMAQVSPAHLRAALGDISRLVDVEAWISHARARMGGAAAAAP